jgi:hypothetical protein
MAVLFGFVFYKCFVSSSSVYRVYSSLSVILQRDSQDKSPTGQYLQIKTGGNLIYTVRNLAGGKLPSVSLNSSCLGLTVLRLFVIVAKNLGAMMCSHFKGCFFISD